MKILVNNEEVVSNSNLQIKEEMLSTSSTILKNCYPKTWELDKDYVSRYYFPKDYSKCKIINEIEHPEIPGTTTKGTNLNINYDDSLKWELNGLFGDTFQNGTPTPDTPVEIQNVTGLQNIEVCGKNLFNNTIIMGVVTNTNIGSSNTRICTQDFIKVQPNTTYTLSFTSSIINQINISYFTSNDFPRSSQSNWVSNFTFTTPNTANYILITFRKSDNSTVNTTDISNIQLEQSSTATTYEPYTETTYEVNLGKNLFDNNGTMYQSTGATVEIIDTGIRATILQTGTNKFGKVVIPNSDKLLGKTVTLSANFSPSASNTGRIALYQLNSTGGTVSSIGTINSSGSTTLNIPSSYSTNATQLGLLFYANTSGTSEVDDYVDYTNVQLELGTQATTYSEYFTPIELNKIGNYQDSIKKSTGKNLFDKDNINEIRGTINANSNIFTYSSTSMNYCFYMPCKPNTTYTIQKRNDGDTNRFKFASCSTEISTQESAVTNLTSRLSDDSASSLTITTGPNDIYIMAQYYRSKETKLTKQQLLDSIMINEGSTALPYEPYGKVWYIEKNTRKLELAIADMDNSENYPGWKNVPNLKQDYNNKNSGLYEIGVLYCSNICVQQETDYVSINTKNTASILFLPKAVWGADHNQTYWKTNYSNLVFTIIYNLQTPEITEITNEELINQLDTIYYDMLNNGINNIIISSENLSMPIEIHYNFKEAWTEEELIFSGLVKNTGKISLNPRQPHYVDLQILDFKDLLSTGETLNYVISGKTITEAINQVVSSISDYGFVVGNINLVNPNELIGAYSTLNKTAYDVFQYIADITQSRWSTRVIDENTIAIDFNDPSLMEEGTPIESTQEFYEDNEINDISFSYSTNDYRNKQIITSDEVYGNVLQTETKVADGYTKTFVCENKIGTITGITLNGVNATFITKSDEALGLSGDFIYQPGETTFISSNTITTGGVIVISYYPIVKGREIVINSAEISRINEQINRKGTISRYENRNDSTSSQELIKIGQSYIKYKGQAEIILKVVSTKNIWNIGQIVSYDAPLEELTTDYMVKSKTIDMYLNANKTFYTYELTSNYNYENAINYFDNQRAKNQGNIGEGETITRNIDLESTALIKFYDTSIEEVSIGTDTTLDFQLDSVII